jgi:hypothetical protein
MGDMSDLALENAFDDFAYYQEHKDLSKSDQYDLGLIDERGLIIGNPTHLPVPRPVKPYGPGPCPRCGGSMILRKNSHTGTEFYGCADFPRCKGNRNL